MYQYAPRCSECLQYFDNVQHTPKILPNCGHTMCSQCIDFCRSLQSPKCIHDFKPFPDKSISSDEYTTNIALLKFIDDRSEIQKCGICPIHHEVMSMLCLTDDVKVCQNCVEGRDDARHQGHDIKALSKFKEEAEVKAKEIQSIIGEIDEADSTGIRLILKNKKEARESKKRKFDEIKQFVDKKEEEMSAEIELLFLQKRTKTEEAFLKDEEMNEKIRIDLAILNKKKMNDKFFEALNKEIDEKCVIKEEEEKMKNLDRKIVNEFKSKDKLLNKDLESVFENHRPASVGLYEIERNEEDLQDIEPIETWIKVKREGDVLNIAYRKVSEGPGLFKDEHAYALATSEGIRTVNIDLRRRRLEKGTGAAICLLLEGVSNVAEVSLNFGFQEKDLFDLFEYHLNKIWTMASIETFTFNKTEERKVTSFNFFKGTKTIMIRTHFLGKMTNLKTLSFSMEGPDPSREIIELADKVLPALTKLKYLDLKIIDTGAEEWEIERLLSKMVGKLKNVTTFHLDLSSSKVSPECLKTLGERVLPSLGVLESFKLWMNHNTLNEIDVKEFLFKSKAWLTEVKALDLSMSFTGTVSNKTVKALAKHVLPITIHLETLSLNFTDNSGEINDKSVKRIFEGCCPDNIKAFKFHIGGHGLTDETVMSFARDLLPKMEKLESLDLVFDSQEITNQSLNELWINLSPHLKTIRSFGFSFRNKDPEEECIHQFINKTLNGMDSLNKLELSITNNFSKGNFEKLFTCLKGLKQNLQELNLELMSDNIITNENIDIFTDEVLPLMNNLKRLKLNFSWTNITSKSLIKICSQIKNLSQFEYLEIIHVAVNWPKPELEEFKNKNPDLQIYDDKIIYI